MNNKTIGSAVALALASTVSFNANATLASNAVLQFSTGVGVCSGGIGTYPDCYDSTTDTSGTSNVISGSYFAFDSNGSNTITDPEKQSMLLLQGVQINATQLASGSHAGTPDGSESPAIDQPFSFFGSTGMHQTTSPITILSDDAAGHVTLNFSGWGMTWVGLPNIPLGGDFVSSYSNDTGIATLTCGLDCSLGDTFTLTYSAHVPAGDPSGIGGISYGLYMEGVISAVPVPAAVWLFGSGLIGLIGFAQRNKAA